MRFAESNQMELGSVWIGEVRLNPKSTDDVPAILVGLQHVCCNERERLFALLEEHISPDVRRDVGRPGMDMWRILVLACLKSGLGCTYARLHDYANEHSKVRQMLGAVDVDVSGGELYSLQSIKDNVRLAGPELWSEVSKLVEESGHRVAKKKAWRASGAPR